jgi:hypothetical protein
MANVYGSNYQKEWINEPSEQADKGSSNASIKCFYDEAAGVAAADLVYICKIQHSVRLLSVTDVAGAALGAGGLTVVDKDGNSTAVSAGDSIDGQVDGGLDLILTADGATAANLKLLAQFLMD